jgi:hypothetical protein
MGGAVALNVLITAALWVAVLSLTVAYWAELKLPRDWPCFPWPKNAAFNVIAMIRIFPFFGAASLYFFCIKPLKLSASIFEAACHFSLVYLPAAFFSTVLFGLFFWVPDTAAQLYFCKEQSYTKLAFRWAMSVGIGVLIVVFLCCRSRCKRFSPGNAIRLGSPSSTNQGRQLETRETTELLDSMIEPVTDYSMSFPRPATTSHLSPNMRPHSPL